MPSIYDIPFRRINEQEATLADYRGKAILVVNVASKCGLTQQYEGLQKLCKLPRPKERGFPLHQGQTDVRT